MSQESLLLAYIKTWGIGLTGGIATGKSTVATLLRGLGYQTIDADQLARLLVMPASPVLAEIISAFGAEMLLADGSLDRAKLAAAVFRNPKKKQLLESILHPAIWQELLATIKKEPFYPHPRPWFYEAALLFETSSAKRFHQIWVTDCPLEVQIARLMQRHHWEREEAIRRIEAQMPQEQKKALADVVVSTLGSQEAINKRLKTLLASWQHPLA